MTATPLPLHAIVELPPETSGALTFHLPLEVFALEAAGAEPALIEERISAGLGDAYRSGLVDPPLYRWAVEHYRPLAPALLSDRADERWAAFEQVRPLGDGLVGAAFHGVIRMGYAAMRGDVDELARGLAYLRTRRQVLQGPIGAGSALTSMPTADDLDGSTVFDQLSLAAGAGGADALTDPDAPLPTATELAGRAAELLRHDASSFVAVHSMTGLHGLVEFHALIAGEPPSSGLERTPLGSWWRAYAIGLRACGLIVSASPRLDAEACTPEPQDRPTLFAAAIESGDTHSVKLAVALLALADHGVIEESLALELGAVKLGADECRS